MRSIVITQKDSKDLPGVKEIHTSIVNNFSVHYALMDAPYPVFDAERNDECVLIQKKAVSLNFRDRALIVLVQNQLNAMPSTRGGFYAIGSEFAGIVTDVGNKVTTFKPGDRVITNCHYPFSDVKGVHPGIPTNQGSREFEIIHQSKLVKMPESMSYEVGACFTICAQTAYAMIDRLNIKKGAKVLVMAATSNTSLFVINKLLQRNDIKLYAAVRSETSKERLLQLKYSLIDIFVLEDKLADFKDSELFVQNLKESGMFDYVIDPFMDTNLPRLTHIINFNGKYISCGVSEQIDATKEFSLQMMHFANIIMKNILVIGNCLGDKKHLEEALEDFDRGVFNVLIKNVNSTDVKQFFEDSFLNKKALGKTVFLYK